MTACGIARRPYHGIVFRLTPLPRGPYSHVKLKANLNDAAVPKQGSASPRCASLAALGPGQRARICTHPSARGVPPRLEELGFVPGTAVEVLRRAPFGDPVELEIRGYRICLRRAELASLCVVPEDARP